MTKKISHVIGTAILAMGAFTSGTASAVPCQGSGRLAEVTPSPSDPTVCHRVVTRFPAPTGTLGCWEAARINNLSCVDPITGMAKIITIAAP